MPAKPPGSKMRHEILEQPAAIEKTLAAETDEIRELAVRLQNGSIRHVVIVARGTSDHAAMYARYAFGIIAHKLTMSIAPSLLTVYDVDLDLKDSLVLGISQSGQAPDVYEFLEQARAKGALTCALTNATKAPIRNVADVVLRTHANEEASVAATKTYTTALAVLHQIATLWAGDVKRASRIYEVPELIRQVLKTEGQIKARAERFRYMDSCSVMARGINLCTALETALKLAECTYVVPASYSGADFLHGYIASIAPGYPCLAYAPRGNAMQFMSEVLDQLEERKAETVVISNHGALLDRATVPFHIPDMPEELSPIVAIVVGQLLSLHLALHKGLDPDTPRGLTKVTATL